MTDISTKEIKVWLLTETFDMLLAFTEARNGSFHNQADIAIRTGIAAIVQDSPPSFRDRYAQALAKGGIAEMTDRAKQMPSARRRPSIVYEDNIPDTPPKKKKTGAVWSASPAAIERALEKMQRDKYLKTTSNGDK